MWVLMLRRDSQLESIVLCASAPLRDASTPPLPRELRGLSSLPMIGAVA